MGKTITFAKSCGETRATFQTAKRYVRRVNNRVPNRFCHRIKVTSKNSLSITCLVITMLYPLPFQIDLLNYNQRIKYHFTFIKVLLKESIRTAQTEQYQLICLILILNFKPLLPFLNRKKLMLLNNIISRYCHSNGHKVYALQRC